MSDKISMDKKYTYKGEPVEIITVARDNTLYPVVAETSVGFSLFTAEGGYRQGGTVQLIEVKPTLWINVYRFYMDLHTTKADADSGAETGRIACIEFNEGDGI
jgi:hypothetical protein